TAQTVEERSRLLLRGRDCYDRCEWNDAFAALKAADEQSPLGAADLHRLAWSAGLIARDEGKLCTTQRGYPAWLEEGEQPSARRLLARVPPHGPRRAEQGERLVEPRAATRRASSWTLRRTGIPSVACCAAPAERR